MQTAARGRPCSHRSQVPAFPANEEIDVIRHLPRSRIGAAIAVGALFALAGTCAAETGVTDTTIKIGMFGPLTGAASINGYPISNGPIAVFNEVNAKGGIHGRKIEVINEDDGCDPAKAHA